MSKQSIIPKEANQISRSPADCGQKEIGPSLKEIHLRARAGMKIKRQGLSDWCCSSDKNASFFQPTASSMRAGLCPPFTCVSLELSPGLENSKSSLNPHPYVCVHRLAYVCQGPQKPEKGIGSLKAGVTVCYEPPAVGAGALTQTL